MNSVCVHNVKYKNNTHTHFLCTSLVTRILTHIYTLFQLISHTPVTLESLLHTYMYTVTHTHTHTHHTHTVSFGLPQANVCIVNSVLACFLKQMSALSIAYLHFFKQMSALSIAYLHVKPCLSASCASSLQHHFPLNSIHTLTIEFHSHPHFRDGSPHPTQRPLTPLLPFLPSGDA